MEYYQIEQNYKNSPITLRYPKIEEIGNTVRLTFSVSFANMNDKTNVIIRKIEMVNHLNKGVVEQSELISIPKDKIGQVITVSFDKSMPFKIDNISILVTIYSENGDKVRVEFIKDKFSNTVVKEVSLGKLDNEEKGVFSKVFNTENNQNNNKYENDNVNSHILEEYRNAIFKEMYFLREEGGRKYKVSNGKFICQSHASYLYSFELESELYLADDSPLTLMIGSETANGTVFISDGFQIIIAIDKDFGNNITFGYISVEPWKLLQKLNEKLSFLNRENQIAWKLLHKGPKLANPNEPKSSITLGQKATIKRAIEHDITVIWGPPGTGKTYVMAGLAQFYVKQGKKVLILSHSNISVDNVIKQIYKRFKENDLEELLHKGKVLRYGYVRDVELQKNELVVSFNYALRGRKNLKEKYDSLVKNRERFQNRTLGLSEQKEKIEIEKEIKSIKAVIKDEEKDIVSRSKIVATTISKLCMDNLFDDLSYDVVMFDEASMAYVPQILCAAMYAEKNFVCVGDFRQLAPIVQYSSNSILNKDIFSFLNIANENKVNYHPWLTMLNKQRRMHPDVSEFSRRNVYFGLLENHETVVNKWDDLNALSPFENHSMNLVNILGTYCSASKNSDNSRFNILSALISLGTALRSYNAQDTLEEDRVGIITPYVAQTRLLRAMFQDMNLKTVSCATVHQFQGSERNVIIFDSVESYPSTKVGWLMSKNENNSVTRLINVAITRARGKFIAVSNVDFWRNKLKGTSNIFYRLIEHMTKNNNVLEIRQNALKNYLETLDFGKNIALYTDFDLCKDILQKDIEQARESIVVSIPSYENDDEVSNYTINLLRKKLVERIEIKVKAKDFDGLSSQWKELSIKSEDAVFPLLLVDDGVLWYGIPMSKGKFEDGNIAYRNVCKLYFRITGKNTISMIKSLANLEYTVNGNQKLKLLEKRGHFHNDGDYMVGLAQYVNDNKECSNCGEPMRLLKSQQGKFYIKCSKCNETDILPVWFVNKYISDKNVHCHRCGALLQAKLKEGRIYVKCDNGDFIKLDEI